MHQFKGKASLVSLTFNNFQNYLQKSFLFIYVFKKINVLCSKFNTVREILKKNKIAHVNAVGLQASQFGFNTSRDIHFIFASIFPYVGELNCFLRVIEYRFSKTQITIQIQP